MCSCLYEQWMADNDVAISSSGDKGHTNVDVASFVFHALRTAPSLVTKLNEVLSVSPIGRVNVWVTAAMIMHVGSDYGQHMLELTARDGACCLPLQKVAKYYKAISTAIRRTRRFADGSPASSAAISHCGYWELPLGRDTTGQTGKGKDQPDINH
ncbi:Hypothetical protein FKW44_023351 [Caligus rogercresseyi]|uniref:Uncharacterized protein n=1 Tax=Caligus rogercresseyi TaxID=217165 RepID=A0A7T8GNU8_CALRO|nr:Hypothetical protein FKW44_023351 [Caligus rogercresseyi]